MPSRNVRHPSCHRGPCAAVLRRCLVELEKSEAVGQDYEHFNLVLSLYQETLYHVVDRDTTAGQLNLAPFEAELELIDRRRDALAILSSFFVGDRLVEHPPMAVRVDDRRAARSVGLVGRLTERLKELEKRAEEAKKISEDYEKAYIASGGLKEQQTTNSDYYASKSAMIRLWIKPFSYSQGN